MKSQNKVKPIKQELLEQCERFVQTRLNTVRLTIAELQHSLSSETKSTAGDKHETGRAMLQLEREKAGQQLVEIQKLNTVLSKINIEKYAKVIGLGNVVFTDTGNYFIAISAGLLEVDGHTFYAISTNTPIGQLLLGKYVGDIVVFRNEQITIEKII